MVFLFCHCFIISDGVGSGALAFYVFVSLAVIWGVFFWLFLWHLLA